MKKFFQPTFRWPAVTLRRELMWAIALKLLVLIALKLAFFPERPTQDDVAQGMATRMGYAPAHDARPQPPQPPHDAVAAPQPTRETP